MKLLGWGFGWWFFLLLGFVLGRRSIRLPMFEGLAVRSKMIDLELSKLVLDGDGYYARSDVET